MTSCRDVDRLATAYVDGELDERRSSAVRGHLRVCASCAERVEDEARVRELAAGLEPIDPPASMWQAIDARLAEAEIGDSHRPAHWFLVQRWLDAVRRNVVAVGLAATGAAIVLILWLPGGDDGESPRSASAPAAATSPAADGNEQVRPSAQPACAGARTHDEQVLCLTRRADQRYLEAIAELSRAVTEERASWSMDEAARFDAAIAELHQAAQVERLRLLGQPAESAPGNRDPLHSIYRAQIDLLSSVVVAGDFTAAAPSSRGAP
jgi:Putative zinc-finger